MMCDVFMCLLNYLLIEIDQTKCRSSRTSSWISPLAETRGTPRASVTTQPATTIRMLFNTILSVALTRIGGFFPCRWPSVARPKRHHITSITSTSQDAIRTISTPTSQTQANAQTNVCTTSFALFAGVQKYKIRYFMHQSCMRRTGRGGQQQRKEGAYWK